MNWGTQSGGCAWAPTETRASMQQESNAGFARPLHRAGCTDFKASSNAPPSASVPPAPPCPSPPGPFSSVIRPIRGSSIMSRPGPPSSVALSGDAACGRRDGARRCSGVTQTGASTTEDRKGPHGSAASMSKEHVMAETRSRAAHYIRAEGIFLGSGRLRRTSLSHVPS